MGPQGIINRYWCTTMDVFSTLAKLLNQNVLTVNSMLMGTIYFNIKLSDYSNNSYNLYIFSD